jgi:hypothetical protein
MIVNQVIPSAELHDKSYRINLRRNLIFVEKDSKYWLRMLKMGFVIKSSFNTEQSEAMMHEYIVRDLYEVNDAILICQWEKINPGTKKEIKIFNSFTLYFSDMVDITHQPYEQNEGPDHWFNDRFGIMTYAEKLTAYCNDTIVSFNKANSIR